MRKVVILCSIMLMLIPLVSQCSRVGKLEINYQTTGLETNCYLIYDSESKEAALIDVGGPIDSLLSIVKERGLALKYFLCTHSHEDHIMGIPAIRDQFPEAKLCLHELEFDDLLIRKEWAYSFFGEEFLNEWAEDPEFRKVLEFDPASFGKPDIYLDDGQMLRLGEFQIRTIHSPGHSPGSLCYYVDRFLFSGIVSLKVPLEESMDCTAPGMIRSHRYSDSIRNYQIVLSSTPVTENQQLSEPKKQTIRKYLSIVLAFSPNSGPVHRYLITSPRKLSRNAQRVVCPAD